MQALGLIRQEIDEKAALASLGDINIDPAGLTLAKLNEVLQRQPHELSPSAKNSTALGWACAGDSCAVVAFFHAPPGREVSPSVAPIELLVSTVGFGRPFQGSVGGIHLGDSVEKLIVICKQRGYQPRTEPHRISWDKDWEIGWTEMEGKISSFVFFNMTLLNRAAAELKAGVK